MYAPSFLGIGNIDTWHHNQLMLALLPKFLITQQMRYFLFLLNRGRSKCSKKQSGSSVCSGPNMGAEGTKLEMSDSKALALFTLMQLDQEVVQKLICMILQWSASF